MFLGSALAFMIMKWRARGIWENSALPKSGIAGLPWMSIIAAIYSAFLVFNLYLFIKDALYGVNNGKSGVFMGILYVAALVIWIIAWCDAQASGHGPRDRRQGDPGRVAQTGLA